VHEIETGNSKGSRKNCDLAACMGEKSNLEDCERESFRNANEKLLLTRRVKNN